MSRKKLVPFKIFSRCIFWCILVFVLLVFLLPFYFLISTSLKNYIDAFTIPPKFIFKPTYVNYAKVLGNSNFPIFFKNSMITSIVPTAISILLGVPAAYAIAHLKFGKKHNYVLFFLCARIAPPMAILFPMYVIFSRVKFIGTYLPMFVTYTMFILPLVVWLMPVYFREIPPELREAAIIDGCTEFMVFYNIMIPLVKTGLSATTIFCVIQAWNEFLFALILSNRSTQTLPVSITTYMTFQGTEWGPMCAAGTIIMLPMIIFGVLVQKNFTKGMTLGAVKG